MVLIARKLHEGETDSEQRLGLTVTLNEPIRIEVAVEITDLVRDCGFKGATFAPKRNGTVVIYHTDDLALSPEEFQKNAKQLLNELKKRYNNLSFDVQKFIIYMPKL